jgi:hypothetical protein
MNNEQNILLIYSPLTSNRLSYIFNIIFNEELGLNFSITQDKDQFLNSPYPKFSYAAENLFPSQLFITARPLLFETDIHHINIDSFSVDGQVAFFKSDENSFFPFDIFAASFYLISRYEEYLPFKPDKFERYPAEESLAFKEGFLELPLVNIWIEMLKEKLTLYFPVFKFKEIKFQYISTIDIDNAWAHLHKGFIRTGLSFLKYILSLNFKGLAEKFMVLTHCKTDPYDNFSFLEELHEKYAIEPVFFILYSKYSRFDKNISQKNLKFQNLIKRLSEKYIIGLHPSYKSNKSENILIDEKTKLEKLIKKPIITSRQHYLKLKMPKTYEKLINLGILQDFSMGYSSHIGFRASFCQSYHFFNLRENQETPLKLVPFNLMDVCFKDYLKIPKEIALIKIKKMITSIKNVNGLFVSLWHNESLSNNDETGWRDVFEQMLDEINNGN